VTNKIRIRKTAKAVGINPGLSQVRSTSARGYKNIREGLHESRGQVSSVSIRQSLLLLFLWLKRHEGWKGEGRGRRGG
jgi:hypothetical protein